MHFLSSQSRSLVLACLCSAALPSQGGDWPHWRGPDRNGISPENLPAGALNNIGGKIVWKAEVGTGFASVSVVGDRLFTTGHRKGTDTVYCLSTKDGSILWKHSFKADLGDKFYEGGPGATPTVAGERVYLLSKWGDLFCLRSTDGAVAWKKQLHEEAGVRVPTWGFNGSATVVGDAVFLNVGTAGMALRTDDGGILWHSEKGDPGYSTPLPVKLNGTAAILLASGKYYLAVDPATGKRLWSHRWITRYGVNAADPLVNGTRVFISSGYNKGCTLLETGGNQVKTIWKNKELRNQFSGSVLIDGHLYGIDGDSNGDASLKCLDWKTGEVKWSFDKCGFGSLLATRDQLLVLDHGGTLWVAPASATGFKPSSSGKILDGKCWTVPVLAHGKLYARNASGTLVCVEW
ncbi:MAG: PQQ-binding-like beta-propeller repeat protein [Verrucomicrobiota bacterium]|nr:PQQ-binding-like beta-propeller repeat protein [Verrucomicrobiota bacterium]